MHSSNSLESKRFNPKKSRRSNNSSYEREKVMYESLPNSRANSKNRSSAALNNKEILRKSPLLVNIKSQDSINVHSFNERPEVLKVKILGNLFRRKTLSIQCLMTI